MIRYFHRSQFWTIFRIWQSERQPHHVVFSNINLVTLFLKSGIVFFFAIVVASLLLCVRTINKTETKQNKTENSKKKKASTWFELMPFLPSEFRSHILKANFVHTAEWLTGGSLPTFETLKTRQRYICSSFTACDRWKFKKRWPRQELYYKI